MSEDKYDLYLSSVHLNVTQNRRKKKAEIIKVSSSHSHGYHSLCVTIDYIPMVAADRPRQRLSHGITHSSCMLADLMALSNPCPERGKGAPTDTSPKGPCNIVHLMFAV